MHDIYCSPKSYKLKLFGKLLFNMVLEPCLVGGHMFEAHHHMLIDLIESNLSSLHISPKIEATSEGGC